MMNPKARQRAMRSFLGALLQSELSIREMQELSDDLMYNSFGRELGAFIREAMTNVPNFLHSSADFNPPIPAQELAYDLITRRRMSKKAVQQLMSLASPGIKQRFLSSDGTLKDLIDEYFAMASSNESQKFLRILEGEPADAYMKGIARRDRGK